MRTTNIFIIFGGLLFIGIIFISLSSYIAKQEPVMILTQKFLMAIPRRDAVIIEQLLEPQYATITRAGDVLTTIHFKSNTGMGAFSHLKEKFMSTAELDRLKLIPHLRPEYIPQDNLATVTLQDNWCIYLRQAGQDWKIYYIDKLEDK